MVLTGSVAAVAVGAVPGSGSRGTGSGGSSAGDGSTSSSEAATPSAVPARSATEIGRAFLDDYVETSGADAGRVVRRDQGGDTVSEGQAYGMLVAEAVGDEKTFTSIWDWTRDHLQRTDGLLAWQWADGKVVDEQPASDADLDAARALLLAGTTFDDPALRKAGKALAGAVLDDLTVTTPLGRILLPGLWADGDGPWSYNASYASPEAFSQLASATGDGRWTELAKGTRAVTRAILDGSALPSDWSQVKTDGTVVPLPGPTGASGTVGYGYDAARLAVRFGESCSADDTALAARLASPLDGKDPLPMQLDLGGSPQNQDESPLGYVARAAARAADGDETGARTDLASADSLARSTPTYFGAAWDALGALMLDTDALGGCPALGSR